MLLPGHERSDKDAERHDVAIASHGLAGWDEPTLAIGAPSRRSLAIWRGNAFMTIVIVAAVVGFSRFGSDANRQAQKLEPADRAGAHVFVRSEVLRVWLPRTLTELARRESQSRSIRSHEELRRILELQHQQDLWYALTMRAHQADGEFRYHGRTSVVR